MKKFFKRISAAALAVVLSGCSNNDVNNTYVSDTTAAETEALTAESEEVTEITEEIPKVEYTDSDILAISWFINDMKSSETFPDMDNFQYYARGLGLERDYFLTPEMWEMFYNEDININKDITGKEYYLIRLNPYKLLDVYAQKNDTDVDSLCSGLSVSAAQLYYNWGYNPASSSYGKSHENMLVTYSEAETDIFGRYNFEDRTSIMKTHMLVVDSFENICTYESELTNSMRINRRDNLKAFTTGSSLYSEYTEAEKSPSYKVNGIGIRAVIPLTLTNAWNAAEGTDKNITPMINVSPFSYGCTDEDFIDIMTYIEQQTDSEKTKKGN